MSLTFILVFCLSRLVYLNYGNWADNYNTLWQTPGITQWGSLPIGNGDLTANVWLDCNEYDISAISPSTLKTTKCRQQSPGQQWIYDSKTKLLKSDLNACVVSTGNSNPVRTVECNETNINQQWIYDTKNLTFKSVSFGSCLDIWHQTGPHIDEVTCIPNAPYQQWIFNNTNGWFISVQNKTMCLTEINNNCKNFDLWFAFAGLGSYDITGELLKIIQLKLSFNPPISTINNDSFYQQLFVSNATIIIKTDKYYIMTWIDKYNNQLNMHMESIQNNNNTFSIMSEIVSWRTSNSFNPGQDTGDHFCNHPNIVPLLADTMLQKGCNNNMNELIFYHRNEWYENTEYQSQFIWEMKQQKLESVLHEFNDPFFNLTFGALLTLNESIRMNNKNNTLLAANISKSSFLSFNFLTMQTNSINIYLNNLCLNQAINIQKQKQLHQEWWDAFWNRSFIEINSVNSNESNITYLISLLANHQRYLDALDGYSKSNKAIKFNGQSFTIQTSGAGGGQPSTPDWRKWSTGYWWQNTRQPYYNTLISGDYDMNIAMYNHYLLQLPLIEARNKIWFNHSGGFFAETAMSNGLFQEGGYGYNCGTNIINPIDNVITWIRYYWNGGLEMINLMLDDYNYYLNDTIIIKYVLPISTQILTHYNEFFGNNINSTTNKYNMYPSSALETWQCPDIPPQRNNCVTNPTEQICGLRIITKRLLNLPSKFGTNEQRLLWQTVQERVPNIPLMTKNNTIIISPGELLPNHTMNKENSELYSVHPYRIFQFFKPNLTLAQNTYKYRRFPCNNGWCQDIMDAAMLGIVSDAKIMLEQRATGSKSQFKWNGFAGNEQDYTPSLDQIEWMRTGLHLMLIQNNFDNGEIYVLPTWPCQWSVYFKLHAINQTVITLDYQGSSDGSNGKVISLNVEPQTRQKDLKFVRCVTA